MTRTEERLADALAAVARGVREETLPPLGGRDTARGGRGTAQWRHARRKWARWLAPVAAAAAVTLVVILASTVHLFAPRQQPGGTARPPGGLPRYYVSAESTGIQVRKTATGAVTARIGLFAGSPGPAAFVMGLAAGDNGREFVAEYTGQGPNGGIETWLYSFHLTGAGRVGGLALVKGGLLPGLQGGSAVAVSPDGSKVALTVYRPVRFRQPDLLQIAVINLRTGARSYWAGGLDRPGFHVSIPSISWAPGGDSLVFLSQWCRAVTPTGFCGPGVPAPQVRTLRVTGGGGQLSSGRVLLHGLVELSNVVQALLTPDGKAVDVVALSGQYRGKAHPVPQDLLLARLPLTPGGHARLLYHSDHGVVRSGGVVFLSSDASGRYLLLTSRRNGWIDHGRLRPLAQPSGAFTDAW